MTLDINAVDTEHDAMEHAQKLQQYSEEQLGFLLAGDATFSRQVAHLAMDGDAWAVWCHAPDHHVQRVNVTSKGGATYRNGRRLSDECMEVLKQIIPEEEWNSQIISVEIGSIEKIKS